MEHERRGDAAGEGVQQELDRIGAFIGAEQHRRFAVGEFERLAARLVFAAGAVEVADGRAVFTAVDPLVAGAELELCEAFVGLESLDRVEGGLDVEPVDVGDLLRDRLLTLAHLASPSVEVSRCQLLRDDRGWRS
jgi:hypothetical protein